MSYRRSQLWRYEPPACPSCGYRVEQAWVDVDDDPTSKDRLVAPGRVTCHTEGCRHGPPLRPADCSCPLVDVTTLGEGMSRFEVGFSPECAVHMGTVKDR